MDWNPNLGTFVSRPDQSSFNFLYNFNYDPFPEVEQPTELMAARVVLPTVDKGGGYRDHPEKKKRLATDQLELLEISFQEEVKLDPERKLKLARELGLQPRQVAVWFQNRRARWKAKQLERLYDALKQEFDAVSKEKNKLQEEVLKLRAMLTDQATRNQVSTGYTEISSEETVETTSAAMHSSSKVQRTSLHHHHLPPQMMPRLPSAAEGDGLFNVDEYNTVSPYYWATFPPYP
ncbi:hypothetical protein Nepgr_030584 [Nepenthes gracilis]|uniref:Homeobox-leucine zipper protein n=1 Tax=Nepenthes gracilis TaxID=150966 RepID=A0AAD3Y6Q1_NEPGR|nr:hypothetical protein Nepgr_030584 [Nepenthes gracilis]